MTTNDEFDAVVAGFDEQEAKARWVTRITGMVMTAAVVVVLAFVLIPVAKVLVVGWRWALS